MGLNNEMINKCVNISELSNYRSPLMVFSILIIVLYHFTDRGGTTSVDIVFRWLFSHGYVGVDIFMVLSGLGLTFSSLKHFNLGEYYIKRWVRIFPFYLFITSLECLLIKEEGFRMALIRSTTLGYWFGLPYIDWFIPALVGLYAVYPLAFKLIIEPRRYYIALFICVLFFLVGIVVSKYELSDWMHLALIYRIPDFLMGCMIATAIKDGYNKTIVASVIGISSTMGVVCLVTKIAGPLHYTWLANLCFTPLYLLVLCCVFRQLSVISIGKGLVRGLGFLGLFTFEWYRISSPFERLLYDKTCPQNHYLFVLLWAVVSALLAYMAYIIFKRVNGFLLKKLIRTKA